MDHADHVELIRDGVPEPGGIWADLGAGTGAFTMALAKLIGPDSHIIAVDKNERALRQLARTMQSRFPDVILHTQVGDFTRQLNLPPLDGVVMANALHFHRDKEAIVKRIRGLLRPDGRLILIEYGTDRGNLWVPHPLSYPTWKALATQAGFSTTRLLRTRSSRFLHQIYSALSVR
jgi:ubiquinone/menaquinone biosynthesis C-methylase UbiE